MFYSLSLFSYFFLYKALCLTNPIETDWIRSQSRSVEITRSCPLKIIMRYRLAGSMVFIYSADSTVDSCYCFLETSQCPQGLSNRTLSWEPIQINPSHGRRQMASRQRAQTVYHSIAHSQLEIIPPLGKRTWFKLRQGDMHLSQWRDRRGQRRRT